MFLNIEIHTEAEITFKKTLYFKKMVTFDWNIKQKTVSSISLEILLQRLV